MENSKIFISHGDIILDKIYDSNLNLIKQDGGGCNWNDLYNLAIMGEKCYAIGSIGNDEEGKIAIKSLENAGVDISNVITEQKSTNIMNIILPSNDLDDNDVIHSWYSPITVKYTMNFSENLPTSLPENLLNNQIYVILDKFLPVNLKLLQNLKKTNSNYVVCLDVGHIRFFEHFTKQYLSNFFEVANFVQLNNNTVDLLFSRFNVKNEIEFFELFNFDLMVLTKGKKGASYLFRENRKVKNINLSPKIISKVVDSSGAGDAFFSVTLREFAYTDVIDTNFITNTFELANKASRDIISQVGSRMVSDK